MGLDPGLARRPIGRTAADVVGPLAARLADLIDRCRHHQRDPALRRSWQSFDPPVGIWRNLPRAEVNLEANPEGSEWILDIAVAARKTVRHAPGQSLIGYVDWRPDNVRLAPQGELAAVHDWDSIQLTGRVHLLAGACSGLTPDAMAAILST